MKSIILALTVLASSVSMASDYVHECSNSNELFHYYPDSQELVYNTNEVYPQSTYNVHFSGLLSAVKGTCEGDDGQTYVYENTRYNIRVQYRDGASGAEQFTCELAVSNIPASVNCID